MLIIFAVLLLVPVALGLALRSVDRGRSGESLRLLVLTALATAVTSPFVGESAIGTGEAANYAMATADTVVQMRQGVFPAYVGQTEFAFNGRIHPLRTAVYFTHATGVLDYLTFRQLSFWGLQNLSLALSVWLAIFTVYACARFGSAREHPWIAAAAAGFFALTPGLLAPAYGMDLYMTVTAAPFVVLALFGAIRSFERRDLGSYLLMAAGLAAAWLSHPPVAVWCTLVCGVLVAGSWLGRRPRWTDAAALVMAGVVGFALSAWAFASALSLKDGIVDAGGTDLIASSVTETTAQVGWQGVLPVRGAGTQLGDYQLGYLGWAIVIALMALSCRRGTALLRTAALAVALVVVLTLPVPFAHEWVWERMPPIFGTLTNSWPMQRSYLVLAGLLALLLPLIWSRITLRGGTPRRWTMVALGLGLAWSTWQAAPFVERGWYTRSLAADATRQHASSNVDITGIAYAFFGLPSTFHQGVRDPEQELRLLSADLSRVVVENRVSAENPEGVREGVLSFYEDGSLNRRVQQILRLEPGVRYRLTLDFATPAFEGTLLFQGHAGLKREYRLPDSGTSAGFGMGEGRPSTLVLWTDSSWPEDVTIDVIPSDPARILPNVFARYRLATIDRERLPMRLLRLSPSLQLEADLPEAGWIETPRMYVPGYVANVDGRLVMPRRSPERLTLVPVPAGRHRVELSYEPPKVLARAAGLTIWTWLGGFAVALSGLILSSASRQGLTVTVPRLTWIASGLCSLAVVALAVTSAREVWIQLRPGSQGPLQFTLALPVDRVGKAEPLASFGEGPGSATVFVRYESLQSIRMGVDVWGFGAKEGPSLPVDYARPVTIKVTTGMLYEGSADQIAREAGLEQATWLRNYTRIWVDGREAFMIAEPERERDSEPIGILRTVTGDGTYQFKFSGEVLAVEQLPLAAAENPLPSRQELERESGPLEVSVQLAAGQPGQAEPLISMGGESNGLVVFVHYIAPDQIRLGVDGPGVDFAVTGNIPIDYSQPIRIALSHPSLYASGADLSGYSAGQQEALTGRYRVALNGTWVLAGAVKSPADGVSFGRNVVRATYPRPVFTGRLMGTGRLDRSRWPVPPGDREAAIRRDAVGPIELRLRFPSGQSGRSQPLLVTGQPGRGTLVFAQFLDETTLRIGVDVWNRALFWSEPINFTPGTTYSLVTSMTPFYPESAPAVAQLSTAARLSLRSRLTVTFDGNQVLNERVDAYDSSPDDITFGVSRIGGSNNESVFLGDVIEVRRQPFPAAP